MAIKMICSDIDGTLLQYGRKKLEGEIFDQIRALHDRGILFCPASGRQYTSLRLLFAPVADCCVFLCENGGVLFKDEHCIAENPMPRALAEEIAHDLWDRSDGQGEVMLSGQNCAYLMERGLGMLDRIQFIGNRYKVISDPSEIPEEIVKVSVYLHEGVEEKSEKEPLRLWGKIEDGKIVPASDPVITCQCIRVPVLDGHTAAVFVNFEKKPTKEQIIEKWRSFKGVPQELNLPSAPKQFIQYLEEDDRPQVKLDVNYENGMGVSLGRLREDSVFDYKFVGLSHNTLRGAAGGAVLIAELLKAQGYITPKDAE